MSTKWYCYLLVDAAGRRTYVGATTDVSRRLRQHNGELSGGAKRTRAHRPWRPLAHVEVGEKIPALQLEWRLKRARGPKKRLELFERLCLERNLVVVK